MVRVGGDPRSEGVAILHYNPRDQHWDEPSPGNILLTGRNQVGTLDTLRIAGGNYVISDISTIEAGMLTK